MHGWRLLVVQPLGVDDTPDGEPLLAIDHLGNDGGFFAKVKNPNYRRLFILAALTACRIGELLGLDIQDLFR